MSYGDYMERIHRFKRYGYDLEHERNFILEKTIPITGSVLEIGTGKGHFTVALARNGCKFVTLDLSAEEQEFARDHIRHLGLADIVDFRVGNAEQLPFPDASFENIFAVNCVHHFEDPFKVVREMMRVVSARGRIVISDFSPRGFEVIESIHRAEGRTHPRGTARVGDTAVFLSQKGYQVHRYQTDLQDMLVADKNSSP